MIGYLKGTVVAIQKNSNNRVILLLETNNIGYEVQIVPRMIATLPAIGESIQVFTHLQVREDQMVLYGFSSLAERDLFRQLVSVSGIGTQLAIALLNTLELTELVQAIVNENTKVLAKTPGVGTKTAQRIALELKTKLAQWRQEAGLTTVVSSGLTVEVQEEIEMTLLALGYTGSEVMQALEVLSQEQQLSSQTSTEEWIKRAIVWMAQEFK
ncbi:holliday junction DNA helicase RuvA [Lyngbya aestuarii BL J]|mgnify:CR=1 FL=1|uniref:Holliday junction branch migration complex subunit RuvA n=1 Tax=Lyngbya aestuarii BL J TaxID=1348334 RepID=U7QEA5_9CYAN|nr:Holliday junction branch migration protein RuvA [Lyngbya aestuarii]ERT05572.1 holliday junction DNA helicase RuvA [Lyngbya aestuarii BL J]